MSNQIKAHGMSFKACHTLVLLAALSLVSCSVPPPYRDLKVKLNPIDVSGEWTLTTHSLSLLIQATEDSIDCAHVFNSTKAESKLTTLTIYSAIKKDNPLTTNISCRHTINLRSDGTCRFSSLLASEVGFEIISNAPQKAGIPDLPKRGNYLDAEGIWKLETGTFGGSHMKNRLAIVIGDEKGPGGKITCYFNFTQDQGHLKLWNYIGDPDSGHYIEYLQTHSQNAQKFEVHSSSPWEMLLK